MAERQFDPVDWMSGALVVVYGDPSTARPRAAWHREAAEALDFLGRHGIVLARIDDRPETTLRAWRLSDLVCRIFGHRPPRRWYTNAAGDGGGWICTRCLTELPGADAMIKLLDGPAAGKELALRRAPVYLRVVIDDITGRVDALDQLDDVPTSTEAVHVYRGERGTLSALRDDIIVCVRGPGGLQQVASAAGKYRYLPEADGEQLRETDAWREWVQAQPPLEVAT